MTTHGKTPAGVARKVLLVGVLGSALVLPASLAAAQEGEGGSNVIELRHGTVTLPPGVSWGVGDTECGYGMVVSLPGGSSLCFSEDRATVWVQYESQSDEPYVHAILASAPAYQLVPAFSFTQTPPPTGPSETPAPGTPSPAITPRPPSTGSGTRGGGTGAWGAVASSLAAIGVAAGLTARLRRR
ncbi:MAG: hypothetical protein IT303_01545 [Dehalococcoidia bacterium]|nr:hypothetical protein [Dehalococcoidia bacterium]